MPKSPILSREIFYDQLGDGTFRILDWCLVSTELGGMIESRHPTLAGHGTTPVANTDVVDCSFTKISQMNEDKFFTLFNTAGWQIPKDFSYETAPIKAKPHIS
jgi:hypothetical protein